jgi:hypothetical protein
VNSSGDQFFLGGKITVQKERLVGVIVSIIVSASMGVVSAVLVVSANPESVKTQSPALIYASNIILSIILGVIIALIIPLGRLGAALARKAGAYPPSFKFILLNAIPISAGNTFIISLLLSFVGVATARMKLPAAALSHLPPFPVMWLGNWIKLLLPTLVISYVLSVILAPIVARLVGVKGPAGGPPNIAVGGPPPSPSSRPHGAPARKDPPSGPPSN